MKNLALGALCVGLVAACGGGGSGKDKNDDITLIDSSTGGADAAATCNPKTQTGCAAGEKCTWFNDQDNPPIGHIGCAPDGTIPLGEACTEGPAGPMGYDQCVKGTVCLSGECKQICDVSGGSPMCDGDHSCQRYADFFEVGGQAVVGVCDPACDPLTQELKVGTTTAACGSPMPAMPSKGCYGYDDYSCAPAGMATWPLTDREMPRTNSSGVAYLNGCAPGFMPLFFEMTGSMKTLCSGLCAAMENDMTMTNPAPAARSEGDATALGKLPTDAAPVAGNATCTVGIKGKETSSVCRFLWQYVLDDAGMLLPAYEMNYADKMGVCMAISFFQYDSDGNMQPDAAYPDCKSLPPRTAGTTGMFDDAMDWGCYNWTNTATAFKAGERQNNLMQDFRVGNMKGKMSMARHQLL
ncbi:MAG: hypothetical protein AB7R00_13620 [Kofleriaceae bacterium]